MDTRATGKALGHCSSRPWGRLGSMAVLMLILTPGTISAGIGGDRGSGAEALPAFHRIEQISTRKARFFEYLTPLIRAENDRIRLQRSRLLDAAAAWTSGELTRPDELRFLRKLSRQYRVDAPDAPVGLLIGELLMRVDVIPRSLVLAQAAKESGWGSSRFARRANNLFGQWCFEAGCGLVPRERPPGMTHEVRTFASVRDSVASYMRNLNTHESYAELRAVRARLRAAERPLSGMRLAEGLTLYSARGGRYVREVQTLIRQNGLESAGVVGVVSGR